MYSRDFLDKIYFSYDKFIYCQCDDMLKKLLLNLIDSCSHLVRPIEDGSVAIIIPTYKKVVIFGKAS